MVGFKSARPTLPFSCMQLQSSRVRLVEASPHDLVSPSDEARCVPRESRFQRMHGPHVFRQTAGVCSRIMRNRARRTCTRDQLHSDLRNILYNGMCSQSSVCRHFLTCQQVANISSCAARCQLAASCLCSWSCRSTRSIEKMLIFPVLTNGAASTPLSSH